MTKINDYERILTVDCNRERTPANIETGSVNVNGEDLFTGCNNDIKALEIQDIIEGLHHKGIIKI